MMYYLKKLLASFLTLLVIVTVVFFMLKVIPGGPFDRDKPLPEVTKERLEEAYGLNDPIHIQYFNYMKGLAKGDLGPSFQQPSYTVQEMIAKGFPQTAKVGALSVILITVLGIVLGVTSALKSNTVLDYTVMILATLGVTIPAFVVGSIFVLIAQKVEWIPVGGLETPIAFVFPVLALSGYSLAFVSRLTRSSMLEVLQQDYIRTAKANGISRGKVIFKYALKNGLIPVVTYIGPMIAALLTGSFVIERIFVINGIGDYFTSSVQNRDHTLTIGITVFYATFYIIMVFIVDILYSIIDPRIKVK